MAERAFVIEGERSVADALGRGVLPRVVLVREDWAPQSSVLPSLMMAAPVVRHASRAVFDSVSDVETPAGVMAVVPMGTPPDPALPLGLALLIDQVRDPGNMGTLIRSAAGFGAACVLTTASSVEPYNPKAVRAAMGSHFAVPIGPFDPPWSDRSRDGCTQIVVAAGEAGVPPEAVDWSLPSVLVIGNEAHGVSADIRSIATVSVSIPMANGVESLNAGIAGAVILSDAARQRRINGVTSVAPERSGTSETERADDD